MKGFIKLLAGLVTSIQAFGFMPLSNHQSVDKHRFDYAVDVVLKQEGGLSDDKSDPGGETNFGISLRYLESIGEDIDGDGEVNARDIIKLNRAGAIDIYRKNWWLKYHYDKINDLDLATKIFSLSVNMGAKRAHKIIQASINRVADKSIVVDGLFGLRTIAAINICDPHILLDEIKLNAARFYINLIMDNKKFSKYLLGWMNRAFS